MPNTIQLKLLENKTIVAELNGKNYAFEGGYRIIAGESGDTQFKIVSIPAQYKDYTISISMTNAQGETMPSDKIKLKNNRQFNLPDEMAVEGYGSITIKATQGDIVAVWFPIKVKVWNNDWKPSRFAPALITVGKTETLAPGSDAYVKNVGTDKYVILDMGIPKGYKGDSGVMVPTSGMFSIWTDRATGKIYADFPDDDNPPQFEFDRETGKIYYII